MEVILLDRVRNLGALGDQVKVKPGFARNYLVPYGKAVIATAENKARFEVRRAELEKVQADALDRARTRAERIRGVTVQIVRKVAEDGKMFGSVNVKDIAEALAGLGFELAKSEIQLPQGPIKETGDHEVDVSLHPEVDLKIIVAVVGEA